MRVFIFRWTILFNPYLFYYIWHKRRKTYTHTNKQIVTLNQPALIHSETAVLVGSSESLAEHACRKPHVLACRILLAGHAETAGTGNRQMTESHHTLQPSQTQHTLYRPQPQLGISLLHKASKRFFTQITPPPCTPLPANPTLGPLSKHFCTREELAQQPDN